MRRRKETARFVATTVGSYSSSPRRHVGEGWQVLPLLAKCGDDTHGELTNTACYESPPREPRGSDSAWGPARWTRSRGRNGMHGPRGERLQSTPPRRRPRPPPTDKGAPQPHGANIVHRAFSHPRSKPPTHPEQFPIRHPIQRLITPPLHADKKRRQKRARAACLRAYSSLIRIRVSSATASQAVKDCFFFSTWQGHWR